MKMYVLSLALLLSLASYSQQSQTCCISKTSCQIASCQTKTASADKHEKAEVKTASIKSIGIESKSSGAFLLSTLIANAIAMISNLACDPSNCDPGSCLPGTPPVCDPSKCKIESCKKN